MTPTLYDDFNCELGEGPLWHPGRGQLFWFDITGKRLLTVQNGQRRIWDLPEMTSAAGWVDDDTLFTASETGFDLFTLSTGTRQRLVPLEADNPVTRSNDGRADPYGGFWIGTMGKKAEDGVGGLYRYFRGEVRTLWPGRTIPNAICFSPDGLWAYYAETRANTVYKFPLDNQGWPKGPPEVFLQLGEGWHPDGAVTDARGHFWNAQWGHHNVAEFDPAGNFVQKIAVPPAHSSCPAFGGPDLTTLYVTSAMQGLSVERRRAEPEHGRTFAIEGAGKGCPEPQVQP